MSHVFISYVRDDTEPVVKLCTSLRKEGVKVWFDQSDILPGKRWKQEVRNAIKGGEFFIACFSPNYVKRSATYMNEELTLAIELLRQKPTDRAWFIPALLAECTVPDREIGAGETLLDLQQVRLYPNWEEGVRQIIAVVRSSDIPGSADSTIRVLFLADSTHGAHLRVDSEFREIQIQMRLSKLADRFQIEVRIISRPEDLSMAMLDVRPAILHFAGHGTSPHLLTFEDSHGNARPLDIKSLTTLLEVFGKRLECIILTRAYSAGMARSLANYASNVIGFPPAMSDSAAIQFSGAFYQALGAGRTVKEAFEFGSVALNLLGESDMPTLVES